MPKQLDALEELLTQHATALREDYSLYPIIDHRFHQIIIDAACNKYISSMYSSISNRILQYRYYIPHKVNMTYLPKAGLLSQLDFQRVEDEFIGSCTQ